MIEITIKEINKIIKRVNPRTESPAILETKFSAALVVSGFMFTGAWLSDGFCIPVIGLIGLIGFTELLLLD